MATVHASESLSTTTVLLSQSIIQSKQIYFT